MKKTFELLRSLIIKFFDDSCLVRASGLAYSTLLAMVPFITIIYAFGGFDTLGRSIETVLLKAIIPTQHQAISQALDGFTRNSLATGTLGMFFFLLTSIFLINTIARNVDSIWGITSTVNFFRRYATYTAILVFGSLLLGISTSISGTIENYVLSVGIKEMSSYNEFLKLILPFVLTLFIFFIMLIVIPSGKVKFKSAAIGAITSAVLFEIVKKIFTYWVLNSVRNSLIYGSVAIIPIFLVGLYLFWLIVLIGVEISFLIQNQDSPLRGNILELNMEERIVLGLDLFLVIAKSYTCKGGGGVTLKDLEKSTSLSYNIVNPFIANFLKNGLILKIHSNKGGFIPSRSLDQISLSDIVSAIYGGKSNVNAVDSISLENGKKFTLGGYDSLSKESLLSLIRGE